MEQIELAVSKRAVIGKQVKALRRKGIVPAVLYGRHLEAPLHLQAQARLLNRVLNQAGTSRLLALQVEGEAMPHMALVREIQREPISGNLYHIDLLDVLMTEKIRVSVPIVLVGESAPVNRNEGVILHAMNEIEIECLPGDLVDAVRVDISELNKVGMEIKVRDLKAQVQNVEILAAPDDLIVRITSLREEKIEEAMPGAQAEVEVITKGKVEEGEAGEG